MNLEKLYKYYENSDLEAKISGVKSVSGETIHDFTYFAQLGEIRANASPQPLLLCTGWIIHIR